MFTLLKLQTLVLVACVSARSSESRGQNVISVDEINDRLRTARKRVQGSNVVSAIEVNDVVPEDDANEAISGDNSTTTAMSANLTDNVTTSSTNNTDNAMSSTSTSTTTETETTTHVETTTSAVTAETETTTPVETTTTAVTTETETTTPVEVETTTAAATTETVTTTGAADTKPTLNETIPHEVLHHLRVEAGTNNVTTATETTTPVETTDDDSDSVVNTDRQTLISRLDAEIEKRNRRTIIFSDQYKEQVRKLHSAKKDEAQKSFSADSADTGSNSGSAEKNDTEQLYPANSTDFYPFTGAEDDSTTLLTPNGPEPGTKTGPEDEYPAGLNIPNIIEGSNAEDSDDVHTNSNTAPEVDPNDPRGTEGRIPADTAEREHMASLQINGGQE